MRTWLPCFGCALVLGLPCGVAQNGPTLVGSGYYADVQVSGDVLPSIVVAPGQVATLQVVGLKPINAQLWAKATTTPLPTKLAGISITIKQSGTISSPVPVLSISQLEVCILSPSPSPECLLTLLTVQIPVDIVFDRPCVGNCSVTPSPTTVPVDLIISENGSDSRTFRVNVVRDSIHIVTGCGGVQYTTCVTHPDGKLVTSSSPALVGETVVIYAYGLGWTDPVVRTGDVAPTPAPSLVRSVRVAVQFDFTPNARPWQYRVFDVAGLYADTVP